MWWVLMSGYKISSTNFVKIHDILWNTYVQEEINFTKKVSLRFENSSRFCFGTPPKINGFLKRGQNLALFTNQREFFFREIDLFLQYAFHKNFVKFHELFVKYNAEANRAAETFQNCPFWQIFEHCALHSAWIPEWFAFLSN